MRASEIFINEALTTSNVKVTRIAKLKQQAGSQAFRMAKERNDPLYVKYLRWRKLALEMKSKIIKKYGTRGLRKAKAASRGMAPQPAQKI